MPQIASLTDVEKEKIKNALRDYKAASGQPIQVPGSQPAMSTPGEIPTTTMTGADVSFGSSPVTIGQRIKTSFGNPQGNVEYLKSQGYENVEQGPEGLVVTKGGIKYPLDPSGPDLGDIFDFGGALPLGGSVAGGLAGGTAGATGGPAGALGGGIAGGAAGGGAGEGLRQLIGKGLGVQADQPWVERAKDVGTETAYGALGELGGRLIVDPALHFLGRSFGNKGTVGAIKDFLSGLTAEERKAALNNPYIRDAMDGKISYDQVAKDLQDASKQFKRQTGNIYKEGVSSLAEKQGDKVFALPNLPDGINNVMLQFRATSRPITEGTGIKSIPGLSDSEVNILNTAIVKMKSFKGGKIQDLIDLKQDIDAILRIGAKDMDKKALGLTGKFDTVAGALSKKLGKEIYSEKVLPALEVINKPYAQAKRVIKDILPFSKEMRTPSFVKSLPGETSGPKRKLVEILESATGKKISQPAEALNLAPKMMETSGFVQPFTKPLIREGMITAGGIKRSLSAIPGLSTAAKAAGKIVNKDTLGRVASNYAGQKLAEFLPGLMKRK